MPLGLAAVSSGYHPAHIGSLLIDVSYDSVVGSGPATFLFCEVRFASVDLALVGDGRLVWGRAVRHYTHDLLVGVGVAMLTDRHADQLVGRHVLLHPLRDVLAERLPVAVSPRNRFHPVEFIG